MDKVCAHPHGVVRRIKVDIRHGLEVLDHEVLVHYQEGPDNYPRDMDSRTLEI